MTSTGLKTLRDTAAFTTRRLSDHDAYVADVIS